MLIINKKKGLINSLKRKMLGEEKFRKNFSLFYKDCSRVSCRECILNKSFKACGLGISRNYSRDISLIRKFEKHGYEIKNSVNTNNMIELINKKFTYDKKVNEFFPDCDLRRYSECDFYLRGNIYGLFYFFEIDWKDGKDTATTKHLNERDAMSFFNFLKEKNISFIQEEMEL